MFISFKRIFQSGWLNFSRNSGLTFATIFILILTILVITSLFALKKGTNLLIAVVEEKVDISVYFKEESSEEEIVKIQQEIVKIPQVKNIEYISKEKALQNFIQKHKDDPTLMESLEELGRNPFLASLNIQSSDPTQYKEISDILENSQFKNSIEKVDYYQKEPIIDRLFAFTSFLNRSGLVFTLVLVTLSILVAFNTIRLAILNFKTEIQVMKLVGASNWYVRGPFLVQGGISGLISVSAAFLITFSIAYFLGPKMEILFTGLNIFNYFKESLGSILLLQFGTGIVLAIFSSFIAIRKYLKV